MYDYVIVTHLPVFYKVNLYNQLAKKLRIHVIFISTDTSEKRAGDFNVLDRSNFSYTLLNTCCFQDRNTLLSCCNLVRQLKTLNFKKLIVSGWDLAEFWCAVLMTPKMRNCVAIESTILDSAVHGFRGIIKKLFLSRISVVFASGQMHIDLVRQLGFSGVIKKTLGVGVINPLLIVNKINKSIYTGKFLFIGRLTAVKNLASTVAFFKAHPELSLTIIGTGEDEAMLRAMDANNVDFLGAINNDALAAHFMSHDFLLLPSLKETWGLVVEEALNLNVPVLISDRCGSMDLIENGVNGLIFSPRDSDSLNLVIESIDQALFEKLLKGASSFSITNKDEYQVRQYVEL
ncbi:glycosyltransferase [Shewanella oncorhynchi]|uniref:glycosyltransferase n=1 Tax=Shewanella oncorhynchi TaxID=2726434 RepID=UPI003D7BF664